MLWFGFGLPRMVQVVTKPFATPQDLMDVQTFFTQHPNVGSALRATHQAVEVIEGNIQWLKNSQDSMSAWLKWWTQ
eukprot:Em0023g612a